MKATELMSQLAADAAAGKTLDFPAFREQLHDAYEQTTDSAERVLLLEIFDSVMDLIERSGSVSPENMSAFRETRAKDYKLLLAREVVIGQNASVELMNAVTQREVQAGRMAEDDELRQIAIRSFAEPHLSVQELLKIEQDRVAKESKPKGWRSWFK
jgi:hypothetical protein